MIENKLNKTKISKKKNNPKTVEVDEYENDTSDEEDIRNTVGNIPLEWYSDYAHLGYDWDGNKILKPTQGDKLDDFLKRVEDPDFWRTVFEPYTNQNVVLTDEDIQLIQRIQSQRIPDAQYEAYEVIILHLNQIEHIFYKAPDSKLLLLILALDRMVYVSSRKDANPKIPRT